MLAIVRSSTRAGGTRQGFRPRIEHLWPPRCVRVEETFGEVPIRWPAWAWPTRADCKAPISMRALSLPASTSPSRASPKVWVELGVIARGRERMARVPLPLRSRHALSRPSLDHKRPSRNSRHPLRRIAQTVDRHCARRMGLLGQRLH